MKNKLLLLFKGCPEATYTGEPIAGFGAGTGRKASHLPPLATNGEVFPWANIRLPLYIHPLYYTLFIHSNFTTQVIRGK